MDKRKLQQRRKELGLTLSDVAKAVGVSEGTVSRWETGNISSIRANKIVKIAKILQTSELWIMGFDIENVDTELFNSIMDKINSTKQTVDKFHIDNNNVKEKINCTKFIIESIRHYDVNELKEVVNYLEFVGLKKQKTS